MQALLEVNKINPHHIDEFIGLKELKRLKTASGKIRKVNIGPKNEFSS